MYQFIVVHSRDYLKKLLIKINGFTDKKIAKIKSDTEQSMKLDWLYKVGYKFELNSWPDSPGS